MLYTNRSLEIINEKDGDRKLEILNMYDRTVVIPIDKKVSNKLISVQGKYHRYLSLEEDVNGRLKLTNKKEDDLYLILDLLDYKCFMKNSVLLKQKDDTGFDVLRYYRISNRCDMCKWGLHILKAPKRKFSILKIFSTSNTEKYLTILNGFVMMHSLETVKEYLKEYKIDFDVEKTEWELLKR